jgi:hypothetical protein
MKTTIKGYQGEPLRCIAREIELAMLKRWNAKFGNGLPG